jgi:hypothetical protein
MPVLRCDNPNVLTRTWRRRDCPPQYSDKALQVVLYYASPTAANSQRYSNRMHIMSPQELQELVEGLCNPLVWHRCPEAFSRLRNAIVSLAKARKLVRSLKNEECRDSRIERAIRHSDRAWAKFRMAFALQSRDDVARDGARTGMSQGDQKRRQAVHNALSALSDAREQCVSSSKPRNASLHLVGQITEVSISPPDALVKRPGMAARRTIMGKHGMCG